jgi:hypothetical protein
MNLDEQLRAALNLEAEMQSTPRPDIDGLIRGGRARRRRRNVARIGVAAAAAALVGGGAYGVTQLDGGDDRSQPGFANDPTQSSESTPSITPAPGNQIVDGWEIIGKPQWIPLRNNYHAATVYAVNRTSNNLSPHIGFVLWAAYQESDARGQFEAPCDGIEVSGEPPESRRELFAAPYRERAVAPGEEVLFSCVQIAVGTQANSGPGDVTIDAETARFRSPKWQP